MMNHLPRTAPKAHKEIDMKKIERALRWMPSWMKIMISFAGGASPLLFAIYFSMAEQRGVEYSAEIYHEVLYGISIVVLTIMMACKIEVMRVSREAGRDFLTGLLNRRSLRNIITALLDQKPTDPNQSIFSVVLLDLDHFKSLNDTLGHGAGDEALKIAAQMLHSVSRASDSVARLGGDEFAIIYSRMNGAESKKRIEALRKTIANDQRFAFKGKNFNEQQITISAGVVAITGAMIGGWRKDGLTAEEIIEEEILPRADALLYQAKRAGKNQVVTDNS